MPSPHRAAALPLALPGLHGPAPGFICEPGWGPPPHGGARVPTGLRSRTPDTSDGRLAPSPACSRLCSPCLTFLPWTHGAFLSSGALRSTSAHVPDCPSLRRGRALSSSTECRAQSPEVQRWPRARLRGGLAQRAEAAEAASPGWCVWGDCGLLL